MRINNTDVDVLPGSVLDHDLEMIINAANNRMRGGGGLNGAIQSAAGPELLDHLVENYPHGAETGQAVVTPGFKLRHPWIAHVAGPDARLGLPNQAELLHNSYTTSLDRAKEKGVRSVGLPSLSTGIYEYPLHEAASIAMNAVKQWLMGNHDHKIEKIVFAMFAPEELEAYQRAMKQHEGQERNASKNIRIAWFDPDEFDDDDEF